MTNGRCRFSLPSTADMIEPDGATIPYPPLTKDLHHEVELIVAMKSGGLNIPADKAHEHIYGYGVGIDLTRRDLQLARAQERAALGSRQIIRPFRTLRRAATGRENRPPGQGPDLALGQRHRTAKGRPHRADLERAGDHRETVGAGSTWRRRHHHDGNAGRVAALSPGDKIECGVDGIGTPEGGDREAGLAAGLPTDAKSPAQEPHLGPFLARRGANSQSVNHKHIR